ncbi:hypothetical protein Tsubulata_010475, partial [Turnera subulata]
MFFFEKKKKKKLFELQDLNEGSYEEENLQEIAAAELRLQQTLECCSRITVAAKSEALVERICEK